jgi:HrpA-like RNA helicase
VSGSFGEADLIVATRIYNYVWREDAADEKGRKKKVDNIDKELENSIAKQFKTLNLAAHQPLIEKAKKLYKSIQRNRLTILYGPTLSGKSTILQVLTACAVDIRLYLAPFRQAMQFIETCDT